CNRRDVTPHHLVFRSAGGSDAPRNVGTVCVWCHLRGVHGGRIRAQGPAENIRWELGPRGAPTLVVHGREREAAWGRLWLPRGPSAPPSPAPAPPRPSAPGWPPRSTRPR